MGIPHREFPRLYTTCLPSHVAQAFMRWALVIYGRHRTLKHDQIPLMNGDHIPGRHNICTIGGRGRQSELRVKLLLDRSRITCLGSQLNTQKRRNCGETQYAKPLYLSYMPLTFHVIFGDIPYKPSTLNHGSGTVKIIMRKSCSVNLLSTQTLCSPEVPHIPEFVFQ
jgi:hypothetical protein